MSIAVLRTYHNEMEARVAAAVLEAAGIPAQVMADNAGGAYPSLSLIFPVRLLVHAEDVEAANEVLDDPDSLEDPDAVEDGLGGGGR